MMKISKHTFIQPLVDQPGAVIGNYLSGSLDIMNESEYADFLQFTEKAKNISDNVTLWENYSNIKYLRERGYVFDNDESENVLIQKKHQEFMDENVKTQTQIIFTPTYACNLSCGYCYQSEYEAAGALKPEIVDQFFAHINEKFAKESPRPYITIFGGEPLMGGDSYKESILYFLEKARDNQYEIAMVTNGQELSTYIPDFIAGKYPIKEIQVTLDGPENVHNERRPSKSGDGTFQKVIAGIHAAVQAGYRINLRSILDKNNMKHLPELASFVDQQGWLDLPEGKFETTLGRNYELHTCQPNTPLYDRLEMWEDYARLAKTHPVLRKFHKPDFHGIKSLVENGELPMPTFDACPAGKKEWAYDFKGGIYGCTASVGVEKYKLGDYVNNISPALQKEQESQAQTWAKRDVLNVSACQTCSVSLSCGGGCGVVACNLSGEILSPDCRPVAQLVALGIDYYELT